MDARYYMGCLTTDYTKGTRTDLFGGRLQKYSEWKARAVFHLFPDSKRKQVMLEIRRVLKDGGSLLIIEWLRSVKAVLVYLIPAFFMFESQSYWVQMLQENGLENIKTLTVGSLGIFFAEKQRALPVCNILTYLYMRENVITRKNRTWHLPC